MASRASAVFGRYGTRPLDLHGDWYTAVGYYPRMVGMDIISHCKDPADLRLPVGADWRESLCGKLAITGTDRRQAKAAMDSLVKAGFLHHEGTFARISLEPEVHTVGSPLEHLRDTVGSPPVHGLHTVGSPPVQQPTQEPETIQEDLGSREVRLTREVREEAPPPVVHFRKPVGEPPPGLPPAEPPLAETILAEHSRRYLELRACPPSENRKAAVKLAEWCERDASQRAFKLGARDLALRVLAGLFASDRAAERRYPLAFAAQDPEEYLTPPAGVKPVVSSRERENIDRVAKLREQYAQMIRKAREAGDEYEVDQLIARRDYEIPRLEARLAS